MDEAEAKGLVARSALAGIVAAVSAASPAWGIPASAALPALDVVVERWQEVRARRAVHALTTAASTAGTSPDDLVVRLTADDESITLLAAALNAAAHTVLKDKIEALGRSLGSLATDRAIVDTEQMWIRIFSDIDAPHVRVLLELLKTDPKRPGELRLVRAGDLEHLIASPAMASVVLQTLVQHGLAQLVEVGRLHPETRARYGINLSAASPLSTGWYMAGGLARECQQRLGDARQSDGFAGHPNPSTI